MKIRKFNFKNDFEQIWEIISISFNVKESVKDIVKDEIADYRGYFIEMNNKAVAAAFYMDYDMHFWGKMLRVPGISFVCTLPEYRNSGLIRELMQVLIEEFRSNGSVFSTLYAFKMEYYLKFGWGYMCESSRYVIKPSMIPNIKRDLYDVDYLSQSGKNDYVRYFNKEHFKRYHGSFKKSIKKEGHYKKYLLSAKGYSQYRQCVIKDKNIVKGIFTWGIDQDKKMTVFEVFWSDEKALFTFLRYIKNFQDQSDEIILILALDQRIEYLMNTLYFQRETKTRQMGRVILIEDFIKMIDLENGHYTLKIKDEQLPQNTGVFKIEAFNGKNKVSRIKEKTKIGLDIKDLTAFIFIEEYANLICELSFADRDTVEFLNAVRGRKTPHTTEFF